MSERSPSRPGDRGRMTPIGKYGELKVSARAGGRRSAASSCGYALYEVPLLPVAQRAEHVLRILAETAG
jgi:hypothetical protein